MGFWTVFAIVLGAASFTASYVQAKKAQKKAKRLADEMAGVLVNKESNIEAIPVVYGERRVGGVRVFMSTSGDDRHEYLYVALVVAEGEVEQISDLEIDEVPATDSRFQGLVSYHYKLGTDDQTTSTILDDALVTVDDSDPNWEYQGVVVTNQAFVNNFRLRGVAYVAIRLKYDAEVFNGVPDFTVKVKGRKVYDPRKDSTSTHYDSSLGVSTHREATTSTWEWTDNPALCLRDYLTNERFGKGLDATDLDDGEFVQAADDLDSFTVTPYSGASSGHKLFRLNAVIDTNEEIFANVEKILLSCRGFLPYTFGKYGLKIDQASTSVMTLDTSTIIGDINIVGSRKEDRFNQVIVKFPDANTRFQPNNAVWPNQSSTNPTLVSDGGSGYLTEAELHDEFLADDDELLVDEVDLEYCTDYYAARDLARIFLWRSRTAINVALQATSEAMELTVGDVVSITHPTPNWTAKKFQVDEMSINYDGTVTLKCVEYDNTIYTYDPAAEEIEAIDIIRGDPGNVQPPTNVSGNNTGSTVLDDGTFHAVLNVSWTASPDATVIEYEVRYKLNTDTAYKYLKTTDTSVRIEGITPGLYNIAVRALDFAGGKSDFVTGTNVDTDVDTSIPGDIENLSFTSGVRAITVEWSNPTDADYAFTEIHVKTSNVTPQGTDSPTAKVAGEEYVYPTAAGVVSRYFFLRAVDRTGNKGSFTGTTNNQGSSLQATGDDIGPGEVDTTEIANDAVTFEKIDVSELSAISADVGSITAGTLQSGGSNAIPDANDSPSGSETGAFIDLDNGKFVFGDANKHLLYDGSTLVVKGELEADILDVIDANIRGQLTANAISAGVVTVESLSAGVFAEFDDRYGTSGGFYVTDTDEFFDGSGTKYVTVGTVAHDTDDIYFECRLNHSWSYNRNDTGDKLKANVSFEYSTDNSTWTAVPSSTTQVATATGVVAQYATLYSIAEDITYTMTGSLLAAGNYYFRVKIVAQNTTNAFQLAALGSGNGVPIAFEVQESSGISAAGGNADTLDGLQGDQFLRSDTNDTFDGDLTITGQLILQGSIDQYNVTDLDVTDKTITVNSGNTQSLSDGAGLIVDRGTADDASITWNESADRFEFTNYIKLPASDPRLLSSGNDYLDFDDDSQSYGTGTNATVLASISDLVLRTNTNDGGGGLFRVSTGGSSPTSLLDITTAGAATFSADVLAQSFTLANGGDRSITGPQNEDLIINARPNDAAEGLHLRINGADKLFINQAGNVGIGTSSPATALEVKSDGARIQVSSADYDVALLGRRGSSGADLDKGYMRLRDTGTTKVAIDSAGPTYFNGGSVGIGTSSPSGLLHIASTGASNIKLEDTDNGFAATELNIQNGGRDFKITTPQDTIFVQGSTEAMRILSGGNVGIGTSSPSVALEVDGTIKASGNGKLQIADDTEGSTFEFNVGGSGALEIYDGSTERMRIDASGNLLVGTTTTTAGNEGMVYFNGSSLRVTRDSDEPLNLDRRTTDGSLVDFKKDGTTVGSIGTINSLLTIGTGDTGIIFNSTSNAVYPWNLSTNGGSNGLIDLGIDTRRWKDLYLSGDIYLSGAKQVGTVYRADVTGVNSSSYVTAFTVTGSQLGSSIRATFVGTSTNVVVNVVADILVNHSQDILIKTLSGFYATLSIKVTSDNNEDFAVEIKHGGSTTTTIKCEVVPLNNESVTFTSSHSFTGSSHEHSANHGFDISGTGGNTGTLRTAGDLIASNAYVENTLYHQGDTNTYLKFDTDRIRLYAGGNLRFDSDNIYLTSGSVVDISSTQTISGTKIFNADIIMGTNSTFRRSNHHMGHMEGSYNDVGANGSKSNPIYTIGSSYNPTDAALSNMYGIGFSRRDQATFLSSFRNSGWGLYVAADGDARIFLDASSGLVSSTAGYDVGNVNVIDSSRNITAGSITSSGNVSVTGNLDVAQSIRHTGDVDTGINFFADQVVIKTGGTDRLNITNSDINIKNTQVFFNSTMGIGAITYAPIENNANSERNWFNIHRANNASYIEFTNRTPAGKIVLSGGLDGGGGEVQRLEIEGGSSTKSVKVLASTDLNLSTTSKLTHGTSTVLDASRNLSNIGTGAFSGKLTINNANYANHLELVRGSDTLYLTPSGGQLITNGGLSADVTNTDDLGRTDKYWANLWLGTSLKMGGTTVLDSSRKLVNSTGLDLSSSTSSGMKATFTDSTANASFYGFHIDYNASGSDACTTDRIHAGLYIDADSSATGGLTNHEHRFYGAYVDARASGDSDNVRGGYFQARVDDFGSANQVTILRGLEGYSIAHQNAGIVSSNIGVYGFASDSSSGSGDTSTTYGGYFTAYASSTSTDNNNAYIGVRSFATVSSTQTANISSLTAVWGEVQLDNDAAADHNVTISNAYVIRAEYDENDSDDSYTVNNGYLFYGNYAGELPTTAYGVYIADDVANYFAGTIRTSDGSTTTASYGFIGDVNTGMYSPANHELGFLQNGTQRLKIDANGVTVPTNRITFHTSNVNPPTSTNATTGARLNLYPSGSGRDYTIGIESSHMWFNTDGGFKWYEDGAIRMHMESGGHLNLSTGSLKISSTTVIDGSRNITSRSIVAVGNGTTDSTTAFTAQNSSGTTIFRARDDGRVLIPSGYLYAQSSEGIYSTGSIKARGGITNDGGNNLSISSGGTDITFNSKNLTSVGAITSGAITSTGTITTTGGNIGLRRDTGSDGATLRDIEFLNSSAEGTDDRVAIIRANNQGGTSTTRGGKLTLYSRKANNAGFNSINLDQLGVLNTGQISSNGSVAAGDASSALGFYVGTTQVITGTRTLQNVTASGDIITSVTNLSDSAWHDVVVYTSSGLRKDTAVEIHGSGYLRAAYLNMTHGQATRNSDTVFFSSTDTYIRKNNAAGFRSSLDVYSKSETDALIPSTSSFVTLSGTQTITGAKTHNADLTVGTSTTDSHLRLYKADNNVSDHLIFFMGSTRMGEIGTQDTTWLRINQVTNKNIYTPRYIRADNGFRVDGSALGITGNGTFRAANGTVSAPGVSFANDTNCGLYIVSTDVVGLATGGAQRQRWHSTGTNVTGDITASGNVTAYSDERLKSDIKTASSEAVYQMRGTAFIKDGKAGAGVIAQEIERVTPHLVHEQDDGYKSVDYMGLTAYLIEAVKAQKETIDQLTKRIEELEDGDN